MRKALIAAALIACAAPAAADEKTLGAGVTLKEATAIEAIAAAPADFVGRTVRVDGVATAICTHMGCWMAITPDGRKDGPSVRLKVDDGVIVFPVTAKGRQVSAQGVVEEVKGAENAEAAGEHAKEDAKASRQYQIKATGAVIR